MTYETYYDILEVSKDASKEEIKQAYRQKAKELHPDRSDDPNARQKFNKLKQAKRVLSDPLERKDYNRMGHRKYTNNRKPVTTTAASAPDTQTPSESEPVTTTSTTTAAAATGETSTSSQEQETATATSEPEPQPDPQPEPEPASESPTQDSSGGFVTSRTGFGLPTSNGTLLRSAFELIKRFIYAITWVVNTIASSIWAVPYGVLSVAVTMLFFSGVVYDTSLYVTVPAAIITISMVSYMIMDPKLGIGGFGFSTLILLIGQNYGVFPGGDGFYIIVGLMSAIVVMAFIQQARYDRNGTEPPSLLQTMIYGEDS